MSRAEKFDDRPNYKVGWWKQMKTVLWRASTSNRREPFVSKIKTIQVIAIAIIAGLVFLQQDNNQDAIQNISGAIFFMITTSSFNSITGALFVFPAELPVFLKEHKLGMYRTDVYFLSKTLAELPWYIIGPFLFCVITYWMIGFRADAAAFFIFVAVVLMVQQAALSFGYLVSTASPSVQVATAIGPPLMMPFLLFGGFFLKDSTVPDYFIWLKYMSWFKYSFEALNINQWDGFGAIGIAELTIWSFSFSLTFANLLQPLWLLLSQTAGTTNPMRALQTLSNELHRARVTSYEELFSDRRPLFQHWVLLLLLIMPGRNRGCNRPANATVPCIKTGNAILESFGINPSDMGLNFILLAVLIVGYRVLAFIALLIRASKK